MTADIINLRQYRKQKARRDGEAQAAENRVRHGRNKAARGEDDQTRTRAEQDLDGKKLESEKDTPGS